MKNTTFAPLWFFITKLGSQKFVWWMLSLFLSCVTLITTLGLMGLSGGFITACTIVGFIPISQQNFNYFLPAALVRFFAISRTFCRWADRIISHEAAFRTISELRLWLYKRLAPLSPRQMLHYHGADLLARLTQDIDALDNLYPRIILPSIASLFSLVCLCAIAHCLIPEHAWIFSLLLVSSLILIAIMAFYLSNNPATQANEQLNQLRRNIIDSIETVDDCAFHQPAWEYQYQKTLNSHHALLSSQFRRNLVKILLRALSSIFIGLFVCLGFYLIKGTTPEKIIAFILLLVAAQELFINAANAGADLSFNQLPAERIHALAQQQANPLFTQQKAQIEHFNLKIEHLSFGWARNSLLLEDINLDIPYGNHIAIIGASGNGKTSLTQLLSRLEDPSQGKITLGNQALSDLDEISLRNAISCAPQTPWAQAATLADNLRLADSHVSTEQMWACLRQVGLESTVKTWPDGLNTWIEATGISLSGGQLRRLSIARTLLRQSPITILDEPTEGLDYQSEQELIHNIQQTLSGRTLIWITHRHAFLASFHKILQLENKQLKDIKDLVL